jgi:hypothetical protein
MGEQLIHQKNALGVKIQVFVVGKTAMYSFRLLL